MKKQVLLVLILCVSFYEVSAQCALGTQFRTTDAATLVEGVRTQIEDRIYAGEYHEITNIVAGNTYTIDLCGAAEDTELTIYDPADMSIGFSSADCGDDGSVQFVAASSGTYKAQVNISGCGTDAVSKLLWATLDVDALSLNDEQLFNFKIYPNPATEILNIETSVSYSQLSVSVFDLTGKLIVTNSFNGSTSITVKVSGLQSGMYLLKINSDNKVKIARLLIN